MRRLSVSIGSLTALCLLSAPAGSADLHGAAPSLDGFRATCEDLATFCFADACAGDQIDAARNCRAQCPSAVIMSVVPSACRCAAPIVLRSRS